MLAAKPSPSPMAKPAAGTQLRLPRNGESKSRRLRPVHHAARLPAVTNALSQSKNFSYDTENNLTGLTDPDGHNISFSYDADGRRVGLAYPNSVQTNYGYDAASELTQIIHQKNGTALVFAEYAYDSDGNRVSMATPDGTNVYSYDPLNRLISASHPAPSNLPILNENFSYDPVGNRLSDAQISGYNYNAANELVSNSSFTYSYDANGNLISKIDSAGNKTTFSYDSENELIGASMPSGVSAVYKYDALGRRIYKSTGSLPSQTQQFIYDNQNILAILDGNNNLVALFTHGPGIDEPLEIRQANGTEYFLHADGLGSIVAATDINGNLVERTEYESYGQPVFLDLRGASPVIESQSFTGSPYAFTSREWDGESRLYFYRARYYDPLAGRFIQQDPLGLIGGIDFYTYVTGNPVIGHDPLGMFNGFPVFNLPPGSMFPPNPPQFPIGQRVTFAQFMSCVESKLPRIVPNAILIEVIADYLELGPVLGPVVSGTALALDVQECLMPPQNSCPLQSVPISNVLLPRGAQ